MYARAAALFHKEASQPPRLTKIEVREFWQVAYYIRHGFNLKYCQRGNRAFMVRRA